jgi:uncharacterized protein (TIGR03118 family)
MATTTEENVNARVEGRRTVRRTSWRVAGSGVVAAGIAVVTALVPVATASAGTQNSFKQTDLVANNSTFGAKLVDSHLKNAWGLAAAPGGPIWVSDNNSGRVTVYSGGVKGSPVTLDLTVSVPGGNATGQVYNGTGAFPVGGTSGAPAQFIVDSDSIGSTQSPGEISAWNGGSSFVVEDSPTGGPGGTPPAGAVFKGLAISGSPTAGPELFAADVANATVDVFNQDFTPVSTPTEFVDPAIPAGYAPFNVQVLGGDIYVTYGEQNGSKTDVVPGPGLGYVDVYSPDGVLIKHLISGGTGSPLNEPWGLAIAPSGFGPFAGDLLVGNLGDGRVNVFDPSTGSPLGTLDGTNGKPLVIHELWGLQVGNASFGGNKAVIFSAGPKQYSHGVLGILKPA